MNPSPNPSPTPSSPTGNILPPTTPTSTQTTPSPRPVATTSLRNMSWTWKITGGIMASGSPTGNRTSAETATGPPSMTAGTSRYSNGEFPPNLPSHLPHQPRAGPTATQDPPPLPPRLRRQPARTVLAEPPRDKAKLKPPTPCAANKPGTAASDDHPPRPADPRLHPPRKPPETPIRPPRPSLSTQTPPTCWTPWIPRPTLRKCC